MREQMWTNVGVAKRERVASVEVEVEGRWDALALSELLIPYHSFLVQHDRQRWVVHARTPGHHGESLDDALATVEDWLTERGLEESVCRVGGRLHQPGDRGRSDVAEFAHPYRGKTAR